jgi:hypothetical protein
MANVSRPVGLRPVRRIDGGGYQGQIETFHIPASDATAVFVGDIVKLAGSADANGVATVARYAANTDLPIGVVVGFVVDPTNLNQPSQYRAASTARYVFVAVGPDVVYEVQATGTTVVADVGLNAGVTFTAGSSTTGQSGMELDATTKATTATLPLKILGWVQRPDVDIADGTSMKVNVLLNTANLGNGTAGV